MELQEESPCWPQQDFKRKYLKNSWRKTEHLEMKHYAPNICLPLKTTCKMANLCSIPFEESPCRKKEIIHSNIYRILPKVNQVIYTLDTICMPNIMTLAQAVLQIFSSKGPLWVKCLSLKRGIIQSNFARIFRKVNQVIYIMYPNCVPDIMILAQAVLQVFCSQGCFSTQNKVGIGE